MTTWHSRASVEPGNIDYPGTTFFVRAKNFLAPPATRDIKYVVIHITGWVGMTESSAINQFLSGPASAHYIVNREGMVIQMVREANIANHVGGIHSVHNQESIGIEHVNPYTPSARMTPTERQYEASARLVQWLCHRYNIPIMHELTPRGRGIKGHIEVSPNSRHVNCPNPAWDWNLYIGLVNNPHPLDVLLEPVLLR